MNNDEEISALYQKIEKQLPSEMIDARIKKLARDKVDSNNKSVRTINNSNLRWLSSAAVIVLSVGVILKVVQQEPVSKNLSDEILQQSLISPMPATTAKDDQEVQGVALERDLAPAMMNEEEMSFGSMRLEKKENRQLLEKKKLKESVERKKVSKRRAQEKPKKSSLPMAPAMIMSEPLMDSVTNFERVEEALTSNWCGQSDLIDEQDKVVWQDRIKQFQESNQLALVKCLEEKMLEVFKE